MGPRFSPPARRAAEYLSIILGLWLVHSRGPVARAAEPAVMLKVVKYSGLVEAVKAQHGKVVVVDVWGEF
jgi:hypothetical protein